MPEPLSLDLTNSTEPGYADFSDIIALNRVIQTFSKYEAWRSLNYDRRWVQNQALYHGNVPIKFWDGTKIPRSHLSNRLIFTYVQSILPILYQAIFGFDPEWFQVEALPGTDPEEAKQVQARLLYLFENPSDKFGNTARNECTLAFLDALVRGIAIAGVEMDPITMEPRVTRISPMDFYWDPAADVNLETGKSVIWRKRLTVDQIDAFRDSEGFNVPSRQTLTEMAMGTPLSVGDTTKAVMEATRNVSNSQGADAQGVFGADRLLEVLLYYTKSKVIWVLNKEHILYKGDNPYGFFPFMVAPCFFDPDHLVGDSYADVLGDRQRYIQGIENGHLDEISLALHPPRAVKNSYNSKLTASQRITRPGAIMTFDNPKEDLVIQNPVNITQNAIQEIQMLKADSMELAGLNQMVMQGVPVRSNASSSATSVRGQMELPSSRLLMVVLSLENYFLMPLLTKMLEMHKMHLMGDLSLQGVSPKGETLEVGNRAMQKDVKFRILASTRMMSRDKLLQMVPMVAQFILNPELMQLYAQMGLVVDIGVFLEMLQDATGTKYRYQLIRPMNEQEQAARMQPSPEQIQQGQQAQAANEVRMQMGQQKLQGEQMRAAAEAQKTQAELAGRKEEVVLKAVLDKVFNADAQKPSNGTSK